MTEQDRLTIQKISAHADWAEGWVCDYAEERSQGSYFLTRDQVLALSIFFKNPQLLFIHASHCLPSEERYSQAVFFLHDVSHVISHTALEMCFSDPAFRSKHDLIIRLLEDFDLPRETLIQGNKFAESINSVVDREFREINYGAYSKEKIIQDIEKRCDTEVQEEFLALLYKWSLYFRETRDQDTPLLHGFLPFLERMKNEQIQVEHILNDYSRSQIFSALSSFLKDFYATVSTLAENLAAKETDLDTLQQTYERALEQRSESLAQLST